MEKRYLLALIYLLVIIPITLSSCAPTAGDEPTAIPQETKDEAAPGSGLDTVAPEATTESLELHPVTDEAVEEVETNVRETDEDLEKEQAEVVEAVTPVIVDLSKITPEPPSESETLREMPQPGIPNPAVALSNRAAVDLANFLGVDVDTIQVVSVESVEWSDSSLGCPKAGQNYLMVITPGYRVLLEADGRQYEYHTDMQNTVVRCSGQAQTGAVER